MTDGHRLAARSALLIAALASGAANADNPTRMVPQREPSLGEYMDDLGGDVAPDRLYAARVLRGRVKLALRQAGWRDPMYAAAAAQDLGDFDQRLAPLCVTQLAVRNVTRPCADILRLLESADAVGPLRAAADAEDRAGVARRLRRAALAIEATNP